MKTDEMNPHGKRQWVLGLELSPEGLFSGVFFWILLTPRSVPDSFRELNGRLFSSGEWVL